MKHLISLYLGQITVESLRSFSYVITDLNLNYLSIQNNLFQQGNSPISLSEGTVPFLYL